ncbi:hypothetical protein HPB52_004972 [Rhipicephalus sanguineus]|uniref:Tick transposon n=1 Tax=Rhipicephalus sanguineus TaxID=34632 RepID=A0A9D4STP5_RHISA|nr:hypothetical protein HPB52_004972 [Rhipicephalus sanguineus]
MSYGEEVLWIPFFVSFWRLPGGLRELFGTSLELPTHPKERILGVSKGRHCVTLEHLLCACPGLAQERSRVTTAYRRQGLPASTLEHFLYPSRPHLPALRSLAEFLEETGIAAYR